MGGQYGQYYLYSNVFDDTTDIFAGATDATNLGTIALLGGLGGGLGGGYGQPAGYYPSYGAPVAPAQGRKRRHIADDADCGKDDEVCQRRKRRSPSKANPDCGDNEECKRTRRSDCDEDEACKRKRRS